MLNAELADVKNAFESILAALCDVVLNVDDSFCFHAPTPQLYDLLMVDSQHYGSKLHARSLLHFMASEQDATSFKEFLSAQAPSKRRERAGGAAACINLRMMNSKGEVFGTEMYGACMRHSSGAQMHVLGLRLTDRVCSETEGLCEPDGLASVVEDIVQIGAQSGVFPKADSVSSIAENGYSEYGISKSDASRIAIPFDAGDPRFKFLEENFLCRTESRSRGCRSLSHWICPEQSAKLEKWVVDQAQADH
jgi:hypothetical protein